MDDLYKPNSNKSKSEVQEVETEHKLDKVINGNVVVKKKTGFQKFAGEIISDDAKNIKSYIFGEVLIPAIKKAISDIVTDGIDMILYGGTGKRSGHKSAVDRVSYRSYYNDPYRHDTVNKSIYSTYSYDDIILDNRGEAEKVLSSLDDLIDSYGIARVADLYDLVGITGNYTDNKYGWSNLSTARVVRVRDGYKLEMPRAVAIQ